MDQILTLISTQRIRNPEILNILTEDDIKKIKLEIGEQCKSEKSDIKMLKILLQIIGISDIQYDNTKTALMLACSSTNNPREKTFELLKYNPDVNKKDNEGKTAMDYACEKGNTYTCRSLMEHSVKQLTETLTNLQTKNEELKTQLTKVQTENEELKTQLTKVQTENEEMKTKLSNLQNKPELLTTQTTEEKYIEFGIELSKSQTEEEYIELCIELLMKKYFSDNEENIANQILKKIEFGYKQCNIPINTTILTPRFTNNYNKHLKDICSKFLCKAQETNKLDKSIKFLINYSSYNNSYSDFTFTFEF